MIPAVEEPATKASATKSAPANQAIPAAER